MGIVGLTDHLSQQLRICQPEKMEVRELPANGELGSKYDESRRGAHISSHILQRHNRIHPENREVSLCSEYGRGDSERGHMNYRH